jgi:hypothetical protein
MERESPVAEASVVDHRSELLKQYSGAVAWVRESGGIHTRLNLVAAAFTRNRRGPFQAHITLYSDRHPAGVTWVSAKGQFDKDLRIEMGEVFGGEGPFEGYVEVVAESPNQDLRPQHYNELWFDYYSDDGRTHLVLPTIQFYGSQKRTLGGQNQIWPGLTASRTFRPSLVAINPYPEDIEFHLTAVSPEGDHLASESQRLPRKSQRRWALLDILPGLTDFLEPHGGIGNLLIASSHKMICYFLIQNADTGTMTGADHLAWFYGEKF